MRVDATGAHHLPRRRDYKEARRAEDDPVWSHPRRIVVRVILLGALAGVLIALDVPTWIYVLAFLVGAPIVYRYTGDYRVMVQEGERRRRERGSTD